MKIENLIKKEAEALTEKVINTFAESENNLRSVLAAAIESKAHRALGIPDFKEYLKTCISKAGVSMDVEYARRQAKAGLVERELKIEIGSMPEGALRPLHENVRRENCKEVFEHACESLEDGK